MGRILMIAPCPAVVGPDALAQAQPHRTPRGDPVPATTDNVHRAEILNGTWSALALTKEAPKVRLTENGRLPPRISSGVT
jgi:hypothetical protein